MDQPLCSPMDTQIFNQGLSVTATSAYIIISALWGDGVKASGEAIGQRWNASPAELEQALAELTALNIIERHSGADGQIIYLVNPASLWGPRSD